MKILAEPHSSANQENQVEVKVWWADLRAGDAARCREILSPEERARVDRFIRPQDARQRTLTFYMTRVLLAQALGCPPAEVPLLKAPEGKPYLAGSPGLEFNLSHAQDGALLALSSKVVGVDVEFVPRQVELLGLASRFFARPEADALAACSPSRRQELFFTIWTRKEAYIKALGTGLAHPLDAFCVLQGLTDREGSPLAEWSLQDLSLPDPLYKGALVTRAPHPKILLQTFEFEA